MDYEKAKWALGFFNQLLLTSDESSDEYESDVILLDYNSNNERSKIKDYMKIIVKYSEEEFRENFRMYRRTFEYILNLIRDKISTLEVDVGRPTISPKQQLLVTLWYFATPDSYRSVCGRFGIGKATGLRTIRRVTNALLELSPTIICWPKEGQINEVVEGFQRMGFPQTIGCIDGTYIPIPLPKENGIAYICRKNFPAIILQAICDDRLCFTNCYAGEVGSNHDARVLKRSSVWNTVRAGENPWFLNNTHLLGDKAYPCMPHLITPYKDNGHLTVQQVKFNYLHASTRSTIERAFGLLKQRWRCLKFLDVRCLEWIPKYIIVCCVLHNICIMQNDVLNLEEDNLNDVEEIEHVDGGIEERDLYRMGNEKRNLLCQMLWDNQ